MKIIQVSSTAPFRQHSAKPSSWWPLWIDLRRARFALGTSFAARRGSRARACRWAMSGSSSTLLLYRHILKAASRFPSKNRAGIVAEIKSEFREARGETDAGELKKKLALARDGLDRMRAFSGLDQGSAKWEVSLKGPYDGD